MNKFFASIYKEILLISRDLGGLIILFVMPLVLVVTVTLLQDGAFRNITEQKTAVLLVDNDYGAVGAHIRKSMEESGFFSVLSDDAIRDLSETKATRMVREGKFPMAIVLPAHLSEDLEREVKQKVDRILSAFMEETSIEDSLKPFEPKEIRLYFDPTLPLSFKETVKTHIDKMMYQIENRSIYTAFEKELGEGKQLPFSTEGSLVTFTEINPTPATQLPNSVQHNVPAWALFAIFFIMAFVSMDKSSLESTSQNSANQLVHRASTNKEDQRSRQTTEESNNMLNPLYWGMGITAIFMIVLGYISNHRPPILEMDEMGIRLRGLSAKREKYFLWQEIEQIEYDISRPRMRSSEPTSRILYFYPKNQEESAVSLDLDDVKNTSFNELHQEISNLAPHIKWLFP